MPMVETDPGALRPATTSGRRTVPKARVRTGAGDVRRVVTLTKRPWSAAVTSRAEVAGERGAGALSRTGG